MMFSLVPSKEANRSRMFESADNSAKMTIIMIIQSWEGGGYSVEVPVASFSRPHLRGYSCPATLNLVKNQSEPWLDLLLWQRTCAFKSLFFFYSRFYPDAFQLKCIDAVHNYHRFVLQQIWVFRGEKGSTFFFFFQIILRITKQGRSKHKASTKVLFSQIEFKFKKPFF